MAENYNYRIEVSDGITTKTENGSIQSYCSGMTNYCSDRTKMYYMFGNWKMYIYII